MAMKLAFSTAVCPNWSFEQIVTKAVEYGFDGLEIGGIQNDHDLPNHPVFRREALPETRERLSNAGLNVAIVGILGRFNSPDRAERQENLELAYRYVKLAQWLGAPFVRVSGGRILRGVDPADACQWVGDAMRALAEYGEDRGVTPLIEMQDDYALSERVRAVLDAADHPNVGVVWDVRQSFMAGEPPQETFECLGRWIKHVHLNDEGPYGYCLFGEGSIPNFQAVELLLRNDYSGYFSLDWAKEWHSDLAEPDVALPHFVMKMRNYASGII